MDNVETPIDPILVQIESILLQSGEIDSNDVLSYSKYKSLTDKNCDFLYILIESKYVKLNEPVVKIGKTVRSVIERFREYSKGSILLGCGRVFNCTVGEKILIEEFKKNYKRRTDIGSEYFEGKISDMEDTFYEMLLKIRKIGKILKKKYDKNSQTLDVSSSNKKENSFPKTTYPKINKEFISYFNYIKINIPDWYLESEWVSTNVLYSKFKEITGSTIKLEVFGRKLGALLHISSEQKSESGIKARGFVLCPIEKLP